MDINNIGVGSIIKIVDSPPTAIPKGVEKYLGRFVEISEVLKIAGYHIYNDGGRWIWDESLFERFSTHDEYMAYHSSSMGGDVDERE